MTIKELKAALANYQDDMLVVIPFFDNDGGFSHYKDIEINSESVVRSKLFDNEYHPLSHYQSGLVLSTVTAVVIE